MAKRYERRIYVSYDPITPEYPNAVLLFDSKIAFVLKDRPRGAAEPEQNVKRVNMERFLDMDILDMQKARYKKNKAIALQLSELACETFGEVAKYHFELEGIYRKSMDFSSKERFTLSFCERLRDAYCK